MINVLCIDLAMANCFVEARVRMYLAVSVDKELGINQQRKYSNFHRA